EQNDDISRRLKDLVRRRRIHRSRNAGHETMSGRVVVAAMRKLPLDAFGASPRLIRQFPIRWIDHNASRRRRQKIAIMTFEAIIRAPCVCGVIAGKIGLAVRHATDGPSLGGRRLSASSTAATLSGAGNGRKRYQKRGQYDVKQYAIPFFHQMNS